MPSTLQSPELRAPEKGLNENLVQRRDHFLELKKQGQVEERPFWTGENKFVWQEIRYGNPNLKEGYELYRGYLMIEPEVIPEVLDILSKLGEEKAKNGETLHFKWLKGLKPQGEDIFNFAFDDSKIGYYEGLKAEDPRIAIYADSQEQILNILQNLADNPRWEAIELNRINKHGGKIENAPRRPGTNSLIHHGKEFRSLNYNDKPGASEDEAADREWRNRKDGAETKEVKIINVEGEMDEDELTEVDLALVADIAVENFPDLSRLILKAITNKGNVYETLNEDITKLKKEGENNNSLYLIAIDLEKALIQYRVENLVKLSESSRGKKSKETRSGLEEEARQLTEKFIKLQEERESRFPDQPDQIVELAALLGVTGDMLAKPIIGIREKLTRAIEDKSVRGELFNILDKEDFPNKEDLKKYIGHEKIEKNVKKFGKKAAMAGGTIGLLALLASWMAMKMESGSRRQQ